MRELTGLEPCMCGHSIEEHQEPSDPRARACSAGDCECPFYEADDSEEDSNADED